MPSEFTGRLTGIGEKSGIASRESRSGARFVSLICSFHVPIA